MATTSQGDCWEDAGQRRWRQSFGEALLERLGECRVGCCFAWFGRYFLFNGFFVCAEFLVLHSASLKKMRMMYVLFYAGIFKPAFSITVSDTKFPSFLCFRSDRWDLSGTRLVSFTSFYFKSKIEKSQGNQRFTTPEGSYSQIHYINNSCQEVSYFE